MGEQLNRALLQIKKRAEKADRSELLDTFVDVGPLFTLLSNPGNQILYGRRGTGKTHAFKYLHGQLSKENDIPIYIDLRNVGSTGGLYGDTDTSLAERATRLLSDTLSYLHEELVEYSLRHTDEVPFERLAPQLDRLAESVTDVQVVGGETTEEKEHRMSEQKESSSKSEIGLKNSSLKASTGSSANRTQSRDTRERISRTGKEHHRVHFGEVSNALKSIEECLSGKRIWILLDEWSSVNLDLQPYLADLLRRSVFPVQGISVKIGAIEQRSNFLLDTKEASYIGIELGADASADVNLDDFMVFDNDKSKAVSFFKKSDRSIF